MVYVQVVRIVPIAMDADVLEYGVFGEFLTEIMGSLSSKTERTSIVSDLVGFKVPRRLRRELTIVVCRTQNYQSAGCFNRL